MERISKMEKKETYKAPEMRSVVLIKEGVMQSASVNSVNNGYDNDNDLGEI